MSEPGSEEPVAVPVEDALDLHSFHPREIPEVVEEYLFCARQAGLREVRLIHGRGQGVQRARVRKVASHSPGVVGIQEATPDRGGWGATIVILAPPDPDGSSKSS